MKRTIAALVMVVFLISSLGGCATTSNTGEKTAVGAGFGALLGGAIGYLATGKASGALAGAAIGAAAGGITGYIIGKHEEEKYKSAEQVYKQNPSFAKKGSTLPPTVVKLEPYIKDQKGHMITAVKTGQPFKLCAQYDIAVGEANSQEVISKEDVILDNYLILPDGTTESRHTLRHPLADISVGGNKSCMSIVEGIPKGNPDGNYTHVAVVKLGDRETKRENQVLVAKSNGEIKIYALHKNN